MGPFILVIFLHSALVCLDFFFRCRRRCCFRCHWELFVVSFGFRCCCCCCLIYPYISIFYTHTSVVGLWRLSVYIYSRYTYIYVWLNVCLGVLNVLVARLKSSCWIFLNVRVSIYIYTLYYIYHHMYMIYNYYYSYYRNGVIFMRVRIRFVIY